ncbi:MAG: hypothetical protein JWO46_1852 [Nocardioidaceae bacterium]|nr:hypothetical protein [Nocardioidaceae bacterium]
MSPRTRVSRRRDERGVVAPSRLMLVAIVVVAIGAAMFFATSPGSKDDAKPAASTKPAATSSAPASTPASSAPATPSPSAEPSSASASPSASPKPSAKPSATATASGSVDKASTQVAVFNNSRRKGLAQRTAAKVTAAGWKVTGTDNWRGNIPATTVYFPQGMQAAAKALAADLGIDRVKAAQSPMRNDRLTVILT